VTYASDLEEEPWRFDFYAALRRAERSHQDMPRIGDSASRREDYLALGEDPYLEFPPSTISRADHDPAGRLRLFVRFLGLLGPQGALPLATTEESYAWWLARDDAFPRFLDLFNHRFLQLFYRAWADSRPIAQHERRHADRFEAYVGAMVGLGSPPFRNLDAVPDGEKLAYTGLMAPKVKSASRLRDLISGLFRIETEVHQFIGSRLVFEAPEWTRLGRSFCVIGGDALVGGTVFSVQDKFRIALVTDSLARYERFLPSGDLCEQLADAVYFYIGDQLEYDVEIAIPADKVKPVTLGKFGRLGWTTWMSPRWKQGDPAIRRDARFHPAERRRSRGLGRMHNTERNHGRHQS
jgi:type VI secretion system protein ImpH